MKERKTIRERIAEALRETPIEEIKRNTEELSALEEDSSPVPEKDALDMLFEMNEQEGPREVTAEYGKTPPFTQQEIDGFLSLVVEDLGEGNDDDATK